ncbi:2-isopropylmalate synthase [Collybia nuda]|uniref:2-isopropylmalate synthase n=1 Tax=Collybia nuda TaxID=64659 RepID=A0A9P5Y4B6_9AGAR|nr:2-isopropylmalate synthase [Collybia nuda]
MPMLTDPSKKYLPYTAVPFPADYIRQWPNRRTTVAPTWLSTDLRDGNQALVNPMSNTTKLELFREIVRCGFKQIEVAYPSASDQEFQFVRSIIENGEVPDDVSLQIITPARPDLIKRSIDSLAGTRHAIIHLYNAVSPVFREVVFRNTKEQTIELTLNAVKLVKKLTEEETARSGTHFTLNYCLETFSQTEAEFAVELGNRVLETWGKATPNDKIMFNLAATVECAPSNYYADMVEYFSTHINQRDSVIISIHPHNDRGTAVAAAELGLLAGGDRIEGCLLGNGERTGNVDLITLALNMYSQGVSPGLDFSRLAETVALVCRCNEMEIPVRYPYAGQLVFSAFAGTHQDAIKKGLDAQATRWAQVDRSGKGIKYWAMPYIPLDPKDLGYGYENLIRVSSQSGKAGAAYVIKQTMALDLPRKMQVTFYKVVQEKSERIGKEMTAPLIMTAFKQAYCLDSKPIGRLFLHSYRLFPLSPSSREPSSPVSDYSDDPQTLIQSEDAGSLLRFEGDLSVDGIRRTVRGDGLGPVLAILEALRTDLNLELNICESAAQTINADSPSHTKTATFIEMSLAGALPGEPSFGNVWGVGVSSDVSTSKCRAVVSAANQLVGGREFPRPRNVFSPHTISEAGGDNWLQEVKLRTGRLLSRSAERERPDSLNIKTRAQT